MVDISEDLQAPTVSPEDIAKVINLAHDMYRRTLLISKLQKHLNEEKEELSKIETDRMPELMRSIGIRSQDLEHGYRLELSPFFRASLPSQTTIDNSTDEDERAKLETRLETGLAWLRKHKAEDLIKNEIKAKLAMGQNKAAKEISTFLKKLKIRFEQKQFVHPGSLSSYLKELVEKGKDVPFDIFQVFSGEIAEIKAPKAAKPTTPRSSK